MSRKGFIAANWKMHGSRDSVVKFTRQLNTVKSDNDVVFIPPSIYLEVAKNTAAVNLAAQHAIAEDQGAFTGAISMPMVADIGCNHVLIGHSERRSLFHENDEDTFAQAQKAFANHLIPIFCIGETDTENQQGKTVEVLTKQLAGLINNTSSANLAKTVIAYEPVWAIGTGRVPEITDIEKIHQKIRSMFAVKSDTIAAEIRIVYGGSVKPDNAKSIFSCNNVDGGLIGGASLDFECFQQIIKAY